jgi:hypothetical protein
LASGQFSQEEEKEKTKENGENERREEDEAHTKMTESTRQLHLAALLLLFHRVKQSQIVHATLAVAHRFLFFIISVATSSGWTKMRYLSMRRNYISRGARIRQ